MLISRCIDKLFLIISLKTNDSFLWNLNLLFVYILIFYILLSLLELLLLKMQNNKYFVHTLLKLQNTVYKNQLLFLFDLILIYKVQPHFHLYILLLFYIFLLSHYDTAQFCSDFLLLYNQHLRRLY